MLTRVRDFGIAMLALTGVVACGVGPALAASAAEIDAEVDTALRHLFATTAESKAVAAKAKAVLVFPDVLKAGFIGGGQFGEGALRRGGRTVAYYNTAAASYGLQAGIQKFGYALFFMSDSALDYLQKSQGWEIGSGPSVVIVDSGRAAALTTTTLKDDVYAFFFDQKGLFAGLGLQGTKITKVDK